MKNKLKIAIVEDNPMFAELLKWELMATDKWEIDLFSDAESFIKQEDSYEIIITDYHLDSGTNQHKLNGGDLIHWLREKEDEGIVLALTGQENVKTAVELMKLGVYDYLVKDENAIKKVFSRLVAIENKLLLQKTRKEYQLRLAKDKRRLRLWMAGLGVSFAASLSIYWWQNFM